LVQKETLLTQPAGSGQRLRAFNPMRCESTVQYRDKILDYGAMKPDGRLTSKQLLALRCDNREMGRRFFLPIMPRAKLYRFDVTLPYVLAIRRHRSPVRGGGGGPQAPAHIPCLVRRGEAAPHQTGDFGGAALHATPLHHLDIAFQGKDR